MRFPAFESEFITKFWNTLVGSYFKSLLCLSQWARDWFAAESLQEGDTGLVHVFQNDPVLIVLTQQTSRAGVSLQARKLAPQPPRRVSR